MKTAIFIPVRMNATRLPGKPLADILGKPMFYRVWENAVRTGFDVYVTTPDHEIANRARELECRVILTSHGARNGSERVWEAYKTVEENGEHYDIIVNLQGDSPMMGAHLIEKAVEAVKEGFDIGVVLSPIKNEEDVQDNSVVKCVISSISTKGNFRRVLYFSRLPVPYGETNFWHNTGIYAYSREALKKYMSVPQTELETKEKLEQLRALEIGLQFGAYLTHEKIVNVDTKKQLEEVIRLLRERE